MMDKTRKSPLAEAVVAAQDWWREAGVDSDFTDEPRDWLADAKAPEPEEVETPRGPVTVVEAEPELPPLGGDRADWPKTLDDFAAWWLEEPSLGIVGPTRRLAPRGAAQAELMILVPAPEADDGERLLSGVQGRLAAAMLSAMGIAEDRAYLAAALPSHAPHPDWAEMAGREYGDILRHHVSLAAPKRLLILGREILTLFRHDPAQDSANARQIALEGIDVPVLVARSPAALLDQQRFRSALWQAWLDWRE